MNKQCADCRQSKPVSDFYKQRRNKDGLQSYCKACHNKRCGDRKKPKKKKKALPLVGKTKVCPKCKVNKDYSLYHVDRDKASGRVARCKECTLSAKKNKYKNDPSYREKLFQNSKKYSPRLSDNILTSLYYKSCNCCGEEFVIRLHGTDTGAQVQQKVCSKECGYHLAKKITMAYQSQRLRTDIEYNLNSRIRTRIHWNLKNYKNRKSFSITASIKDLPYTGKQLKAHLEKKFQPGMTWEKFLNAEIHIDHIRPLASFSYKHPSDPQFKEAWALSNLQPLWAKDNLRKGAKLVTGTQNRLQL